MYLDIQDFNVFMWLKLYVAVLLFTYMKPLNAFIVLAIIATTYRYVVAQIYGLHVVPIMDLNCFYSNDKAIPNIISCTPMSEGKPEYAREAFMRIVDAHLKARCETVNVFGDIYYKEIFDKDKIIKNQIIELPDGKMKTKDDVAEFVAENLPIQFRDDEPKWKVWV